MSVLAWGRQWGRVYKGAWKPWGNGYVHCLDYGK